MKDNKLLELESIVQSGDCVIFLGSGISVGIYPSWSELIKKLCVRCGVDIGERNLSDPNTLLSLADDCKSENIDEYCEVLKEEFAKPIMNNPVKYEYAKSAPFLSYVTSNYDPLLAHNMRGSKRKVFTHIKGLNGFVINEAVYYIHGYISVGDNVEPDQIILTKSDFDREYDPQGPGNINDFLKHLVKYKHILFVGCRLNEEPIQDLLEICEKSRQVAEGNTTNKHYILLPDEGISLSSDTDASKDKLREESLENKYDRYGINVVRYKKTTGDNHIELQNILEEWSNLQKPQVASPMSTGGPEL